MENWLPGTAMFERWHNLPVVLMASLIKWTIRKVQSLFPEPSR
jgi:hypothetical protein